MRGICVESRNKGLLNWILGLEKDKWLANLKIVEFSDKLAEHYCEFNLLHPFREGNGRTQRYLFDFIANSNGFYSVGRNRA